MPLERLNFTSLRFQRDLFAVKFLYRLLHDAIDCPNLLRQLNFSVLRVSSRLSTIFYCPKARTNIMLKSPIY